MEKQHLLEYTQRRFGNEAQKPTVKEIAFISLAVSEQIARMERGIREAEEQLEREFLITSIL